MKRVTIFDADGHDISDEIKLVNSRALPGGWSSADFEYNGNVIGYHESGGLHLNAPYTYRIDVE